jgi:hypothetical protein
MNEVSGSPALVWTKWLTTKCLRLTLKNNPRLPLRCYSLCWKLNWLHWKAVRFIYVRIFCHFGNAKKWKLLVRKWTYLHGLTCRKMAILVFTIVRTSKSVGVVMCIATAGFVTVHIQFAPMATCRWEEQHEYVISYLAKTLENYLFEWIPVLNKSDRAKCINH